MGTYHRADFVEIVISTKSQEDIVMETKPIATQREEEIIEELQSRFDAALAVTDPKKLRMFGRYPEFSAAEVRMRSIWNTPWLSREFKKTCDDMWKPVKDKISLRCATAYEEHKNNIEREKLEKEAERTDIERFEDICRDAMTGWYEFLNPITHDEKKMYDALKKIHQTEDIPQETIKEYERLCEEAKVEIEQKRTSVIREHAMDNLKERNQVTMKNYVRMVNDPSWKIYLGYLQHLDEKDVHDFSSSRLVEILGLIAHYSMTQINDPSITEETIVPTDVCNALRILRTTLLAYAIVGIDDLDYRNVVHTLLQKSYEITKPGGWMRDFYYKMFPDELIVTEDSDEE
jgi:hypothetical protein